MKIELPWIEMDAETEIDSVRAALRFEKREAGSEKQIWM